MIDRIFTWIVTRKFGVIFFFFFSFSKKWIPAKSGFKFKFSISRAFQDLFRKSIKGEEEETNAYKASIEKSDR